MNAELEQSALDAQLESDIDSALRVMLETRDEAVAKTAFDMMRELIACRSPQRIREMERRMGLLREGR